MSPTEGEGVIYVFGTDLVGVGVSVDVSQLDSFLFARYLMNQMGDFKQLSMDIILGHVEQLVRFWWP